MTYKKLILQSIYVLIFLVITNGYSFSEEQKLAFLLEKTKIKPKAALKKVLVSPVQREMLLKSDEIRRRFSIPRMRNDEEFPAKRRKLFEITLLGSYMISAGNSIVEKGAPGLFSGRYSPWFGQGYEDFGWSGHNSPLSLDSVLGAAVIKQQNGFLTGIKFGFNILPRFQIELVYKVGEPSIAFDDDAWELIRSVLLDSVDTLREADRRVDYKDGSRRSEERTSLFGLNINFNILVRGPIIPYVSLGIVSVKHGTDTAHIEYSLTQHLGDEGAATYGLSVQNLREDAGACPNFGLGTKIFLGKNLGIKIETKAVYARLRVEQWVATGFHRDGQIWLVYDEYHDIAAIQKTNRFLIDGGIGLFFSW